jgi:hypothetical protein
VKVFIDTNILIDNLGQKISHSSRAAYFFMFLFDIIATIKIPNISPYYVLEYNRRKL